MYFTSDVSPPSVKDPGFTEVLTCDKIAHLIGTSIIKVLFVFMSLVGVLESPMRILRVLVFLRTQDTQGGPTLQSRSVLTKPESTPTPVGTGGEETFYTF